MRVITHDRRENSIGQKGNRKIADLPLAIKITEV